MNEQFKVKKQSAPEIVSDKIRELISNGEWVPGQKIPSENSLAEAFGVNRLTIRIALQKLNALGILDTRVGDGTYVCCFDFGRYIGEVADFYMTPKLLDDVAEFRTLLEIESSRLAIARATNEDFAELKRCAQAFEEVSAQYFEAKETGNLALAEKLLDDVHEKDICFHQQICIMSHNDLIRYAYSLAKPVIKEYISNLCELREDNVAFGGVHHHWEIYTAIVNRDFKTCKKIYADMIDYRQPGSKT